MSALPDTPRHSPHPSMDSSNSPMIPYRNTSLSESTPVRNSFHQHDMDMTIFSSGGIGAGGGGHGSGGLGNLADELADAGLSDGDDEDYDTASGAPGISLNSHGGAAQLGKEGARDSGVDVGSPRGTASGNCAKNKNLTLPSVNGRSHRRPASEYDGSEYGSESDLESTNLPPSLVARIDAVEWLARRGTEHTGSATDGAFKRVTEGLRDLGSQSGVEGRASRLITAHSALTSHLSHQARQLQSLSFPLFSPLVPPPDLETIDGLLPMLISLSDTMPRPPTSAFSSLTALHTITSDLVQTLNYLSDTLHMSRQTTTTATRRLKSARELVADMRREEELREAGERWLTRGNWSERLEKRECANVCGEVVGGFEEVCNGWRAKLLAQASSQA